MPIIATFGTVNTDTLGEYVFPVSVAESVYSLHRTDFDVRRIGGSDVEEFDTFLSGSGDTYEFVIMPIIGVSGEAWVRLNGNVIKTSDNSDDSITATPVKFKYNTIIPEVVDVVLPTFIEAGEQSVLIDFNGPITGLRAHSFSYDGIDPGQPLLFASDSLTDPMMARDTPYNDSSVPRRYFRLQFTFPDPPPQGTLNIALLENQVCIETGDLVSILPEFPMFDDQMLTVGEPYIETFNIFGTDILDVDVQMLPDGITSTWDAPVLTISGTPTTQGTVNSIIQATLADGRAITQQINFVIGT